MRHADRVEGWRGCGRGRPGRAAAYRLADGVVEVGAEVICGWVVEWGWGVGRAERKERREREGEREKENVDREGRRETKRQRKA